MKSIITILILVVGVVFIIQALPEDNLVSVVDRQIQPEGEIKERTTDREICVGEYCDGHMSGEDNFTVVQVPLITSGGDVGCGDKIIFAPHTVEPKTTAVLDATYRTLFELKEFPEIKEDNVRNVVGSEMKLIYEGVSLKDRVARLQLSGMTETIAHCSVPAFRAQIEQAALQFNTVNTLEVYINGDQWDWCDYSDAEPEESGCDTTSRHWVVEK